MFWYFSVRVDFSFSLIAWWSISVQRINRKPSFHFHFVQFNPYSHVCVWINGFELVNMTVWWVSLYHLTFAYLSA